MNEPKGAEGLGEIRKAHEYALERVGCDIFAGPLWLDYIELLQVPLRTSPNHKPFISRYTALANTSCCMHRKGPPHAVPRVC